MSHWPSTKATRVLSALQRLGWRIKRQSVRDMEAGRWARKTEFIPRKDGTFLRRITLRDGTVVKEHVVNWLDEAERRAAELRSGKVRAIPGDKVFSRIEAKYKKK